MENSPKIPWYIAAAVIIIDAILKFIRFNIIAILYGLISLSLGIVIIIYFSIRKDPIPIRGIFALLFAIILFILGIFLGSMISYWLAAFILFIYACLRWTTWKHKGK